MIDYEAISHKNERELGTKLKSRRTQISLYADPTHFVYELLQNADDHGATEITFRLLPDRLIVEHNAKERFDVKHIEAISSFEDSTSEGELLKTGKFGLGFKSVFAFTATPRVFCGDVNFEIYDLYRLRALPKPHDLDSSLTRFELPFNHIDKNPEFIFQEHMKSADTAIEIIHDKFNSLEDITLLFTRKLAAIRMTSKDSRYTWTRSTSADGTLTIAAPKASATFRVRNKDIDWKGRKHRPVQIAIRLDKDGSPIPSNENLVVTFPTSISTGMGIILNGPYRTTPARETVGEGDEFNEFLVSRTADLLTEMIREERDASRLSLKFLEILPIESSRSDGPGFFRPIHKRTRTMLVEEQVLPAASGAYVAGKNARIARGQYIAELFSDTHLTTLYKSLSPLYWLTSDLTEANTPRLFRALAGGGKNIYGTPSGGEGLVADVIVRPEQILATLSQTFLAAQSDSWITSLYCALHVASATARKAAENCPIIRLTDATHVPVKTDDLPSAYLPSEAETTFRTVSAAVLTENDAWDYLRSVDYAEPDLVAEVIDHIVPLYTSGTPPSASENLAHLKMIMGAFATDSTVKRQRLDALLKQTAFIRCKHFASKHEGYASPLDVYFATDDLVLYFEGNPTAKAVRASYSTEVMNALRKLGVDDIPRRIPKDSGDPPVCKYTPRPAEVRVENYELDGLEWLLSRFRVEAEVDRKSKWTACLCRVLTSLVNRNGDSVNARRHYLSGSVFKTVPQVQVYEALFISRLKNNAWVIASDGRCLRPEEASLDDLAEELLQHETLLATLGVQPAAAQKCAEERRVAAAYASMLGLDLGQIEFVRQHNKEFEEWRRSLVTKLANRNAITKAMLTVSDRRRQKLQERKELAPARESVRKTRSVPSYSSTEIDPESLFRFYRSEEDEKLFCQICLGDMPFQKRDGDEYSECVTLLTKTWAAGRNLSLKVMTPLNLILCPTCSSFYKEYVHKDLGLQDALFEEVSNGHDREVVIRCSNLNDHEPDRKIHFDPTHWSDIRVCLG